VNSYLIFFAGEVAVFLVLDLLLAVRVYRVFPGLPRRWWPGLGLVMAWKLVRVHSWLRRRLGGIYAASSQFPLGPHHSNATREFVETIQRYSRLTAEGGKE